MNKICLKYGYSSPSIYNWDKKLNRLVGTTNDIVAENVRLRALISDQEIQIQDLFRVIQNSTNTLKKVADLSLVEYEQETAKVLQFKKAS